MTGLSFEHAKKIVRKTSKTASSTNTLWQFLKVTKSRILRFYVTVSNARGGKMSHGGYMYKIAVACSIDSVLSVRLKSAT